MAKSAMFTRRPSSIHQQAQRLDRGRAFRDPVMPRQCTGRNAAAGDQMAGGEALRYLGLELLAGVAIAVGDDNEVTEEQSPPAPVNQLQITVVTEKLDTRQQQVAYLRYDITGEQRCWTGTIHAPGSERPVAVSKSRGGQLLQALCARMCRFGSSNLRHLVAQRLCCRGDPLLAGLTHGGVPVREMFDLAHCRAPWFGDVLLGKIIPN